MNDIYINGILSSDHSRRVQQSMISRYTGNYVDQVHNHSEGAKKDLYNSGVGLLSNRLGFLLEFQAARSLIGKILNAVSLGRKVTVYAHSQGSIILRNALETIRPFKDIWSKVVKGIKVVSYGAANFIWPKKLRVKSFVHCADILSRTLHKVNQYLFQNSILGKNNKIAKVIHLNNNEQDPVKAHSLANYLKFRS